MKNISHLIRGGFLALLAIVGFTVVRFLTLPESWGEYGHYRAKAVAEEMANEPVYQGADACKKCHAQRHEEWSSGKHGVVNCEDCHGQAKEHVVKPVVKSGPKTIAINRSMDLCLRCHRELSARPHDVTESPHPQIDPEKHLKGECFKCHNSHHPDLKRPEEKTVADVEKEIVVAATVEKEAVKPVKETKAGAVVTERARSIYADKCLVCHGEKGSPADFLDPKPMDLSSPAFKKLTPAQIIGFISKGKGQQMPAYEKELSEEEIQEVAGYIQSFKK